MTVFETIITESAPQHFHLSASDVLDIQDTTSATEIVCALRRKLPGFMDSERKVNAMKAKSVREFGSQRELIQVGKSTLNVCARLSCTFTGGFLKMSVGRFKVMGEIVVGKILLPSH